MKSSMTLNQVRDKSREKHLSKKQSKLIKCSEEKCECIKTLLFSQTGHSVVYCMVNSEVFQSSI